MTSSDDVARYYTRGVRFPRLVGQTPDGTRLPGGPYTMTQAVGGLAVFIGGQILRPLWGGRGLLSDYAFLFAAVAVTVAGLRFVRTSGRDPLVSAIALLSVYRQPRHGRLGARPLRIPKPHRVRGVPVIVIGRRAITAPDLAATAVEPAPAETDSPVAPQEPAPGYLAIHPMPVLVPPRPAAVTSPSAQLVHGPAPAAATPAAAAGQPAPIRQAAPETPSAPAPPGGEPPRQLVLSGVGQLLAAAGARTARTACTPAHPRPSERSPGA